MFQIFYHEQLIGMSALEGGDPPMGCVEGVFLANEAFADFRAKVPPEVDEDPAMKRWIGLSARTEHGAEIECLDAVLFEWNFGDRTELYVDVLCIPHQIYEELFPGRYAAYEASFKTERS